jgi:hypothetical protein
MKDIFDAKKRIEQRMSKASANSHKSPSKSKAHEVLKEFNVDILHEENISNGDSINIEVKSTTQNTALMILEDLIEKRFREVGRASSILTS